eukprot:scaffold253328_cov14-Tisochrysis_lutea.AAC.1
MHKCGPGSLPLQGTITLVKQPLLIPDHYSFGDGVVVPMWAGEEVSWQGVAISRKVPQRKLNQLAKNVKPALKAMEEKADLNCKQR